MNTQLELSADINCVQRGELAVNIEGLPPTTQQQQQQSCSSSSGAAAAARHLVPPLPLPYKATSPYT